MQPEPRCQQRRAWYARTSKIHAKVPAVGGWVATADSYLMEHRAILRGKEDVDRQQELVHGCF